MTPAEIKRTNLYRTLAPCIVKKDREELARRLAHASTQCSDFDGNKDRLIAAFCFGQTAEGHEYWWELRDRLLSANHESQY